MTFAKLKGKEMATIVGAYFCISRKKKLEEACPLPPL